MFFSNLMFSKRGSLAKVWLAAHHQDKKVTKSTVISTNIEESVHEIVEPAAPLALRLSGQLLLGVVRIYNRKAKYLQEDCNDALTKIKMSFRPGAVNLPNNMVTASSNTITTVEGGGIDLEIPDGTLSQYFEVDEEDEGDYQDYMHVVARDTDITMDEPASFLSQPMDPFAGDAQLGDGDEEPIELLDDVFVDDINEEKYQDQVEVGRDAGTMLDDQPDFEFGDIIPKDSQSADVELTNIDHEEVPVDVPLHLDSKVSYDFPDDDLAQFQDNVVVDLDSVAGMPDVDIRVKRKRAETKVIHDSVTQIKMSLLKSWLKDTSSIVCARQFACFSVNKRRRFHSGEEIFLPPVYITPIAPELRLLLKSSRDMASCARPETSSDNFHGHEDVQATRSEATAQESDFILESSNPISDNLHADVGLDQPLPPVQDDFICPVENEPMLSVEEEPLLPVEDEPLPHVENENFDGAAGTADEFTMQEQIDESEDVILGRSEPMKPRDTDMAKTEWSERTKKMYHLFANKLPTQDSTLQMHSLVEGQSRSTVAGVFLEMLVLKSHDYIELKQGKPYGDITVQRAASFERPLPDVDAAA